jgi:hypothetical protein
MMITRRNHYVRGFSSSTANANAKEPCCLLLHSFAVKFDLRQIRLRPATILLGMHDTDKEDYIAQAERHITFVQERIGRQRRIIDELAQTGRETDCAVSMLHALETCLRALEQHRETIFERCEA